jgi:hypothetical protein
VLGPTNNLSLHCAHIVDSTENSSKYSRMSRAQVPYQLLR